MVGRERQSGVRHIEVDRDACQGYANCVMGASEYFDLDDDGKVILLNAEVPPELESDVAAAVRSCPVSALRLVDE